MGTARRRTSRWLAVAAMTGALAGVALVAPAGAMQSGPPTHDHDCQCTTTTTAAPTTTTAPVSTTSVGAVTTIVSSTTQPRVTTTTFHQQIVTTTTAPSSTTMPPPGITTMFVPTTTIANHNLPFTGGSVGFPFLFGVGSLVAGALLLLRRNGSWRANS